MFILYTVAPLLYRMASSAYYNLSLLSSDWYGLIIGKFHAENHALCIHSPCLGLGLYVCLSIA
jgi:solute carrier family 35 protein F1/2